MGLSIVILAAGKGTRMVSDLPKVLHPVAGKPILEHIVQTCQQLSPEQIIIVYGYEGERVQQALGNYDIEWVEQKEQLGTGHAVQQALSVASDNNDILILCGDVPLIHTNSLQRLCEASAGTKQMGLLTAFVDDPRSYGRVVRDEDYHIQAIVECKDASEKQKAINEVNTGVYCIPCRLLKSWLQQLEPNNSQKEYYLTDVISMAVADNIDIATAHPDQGYEILGANNRTQLMQIERLYQREQAEKLLEQGVTLYDPNRFDLRGEVTVGRDVTIDVNVIFSGKVAIGNGCNIGANVILDNVSLGDNVEVAPFSHLQDATVADDAVIGPYARLRPGSDIQAGAKIGNFVEIKKSVIGKKSKVNHLSYVGDAEVGNNVNVGAGVITCNYDGVNKFKTTIKDGVFIGSDSQLIAPVTIGENAFIAAGSTINKDAPPDKLSIARAKQLVIEGWKKPVKDKE